MLGCLIPKSRFTREMILVGNSAYISRREMATFGKIRNFQRREPTATPLPLREWLTGLCPRTMSLGTLAGLVQRPVNHQGGPGGVAFNDALAMCLRGEVTR